MGTADGTIVGTTKIVDSGSPSGRFNIVLVAEGYRQAELPVFATHAQQFVDSLFATAPLGEFQCGTINVYRIDVASTDSGADDPAACGGTGATPATYFDASFCNAGIRRLLLVNTTTVLGVVNARIPEWHLIIVIVNSPLWGGAGGLIGTTSVAPGWQNVAIHEMGHAAFGLADEYEYWAGCGIDVGQDVYPGAEPAAPNVTADSNRATIKWGNLILAATPMPTTANADCTLCDPQPSPVGAGTVGAFEGGQYYHCGIFRPEFSCMMRNLSPFCAVCRRRIRQTLSPFRADCLAPVFKGANVLSCFIMAIIYLVVIVVLILFSWVPGVLCTIKGLLFRIRHCRRGNSNPCIGL